jgi:hypothetical protein
MEFIEILTLLNPIVSIIDLIIRYRWKQEEKKEKEKEKRESLIPFV